MKIVVVTLTISLLANLALFLFLTDDRNPNASWYIEMLMRMENRAELIKGIGGAGRTCGVADINDIATALPQAKKPEFGSVEILRRILPPRFEKHKECFATAEMVDIVINNDVGFISSVWRCELDGMIGEFQLTNTVSRMVAGNTDVCMVANFPSSLGIPIGAATKFTY